jgi:hypothetical protein
VTTRRRARAISGKTWLFELPQATASDLEIAPGIVVARIIPDGLGELPLGVVELAQSRKSDSQVVVSTAQARIAANGRAIVSGRALVIAPVGKDHSQAKVSVDGVRIEPDRVTIMSRRGFKSALASEDLGQVKMGFDRPRIEPEGLGMLGRRRIDSLARKGNSEVIADRHAGGIERQRLRSRRDEDTWHEGRDDGEPWAKNAWTRRAQRVG